MELDLANLPWQSDGEFNARLAIGDPEAKQYEAYLWLQAYADQINGHIVEHNNDVDNGSSWENNKYDKICVEELIDIGRSYQGTSDWEEYICKGGIFEGFGTDRLFWPMMNQFLGVPNVDHGGIFSCSC